ncbi:hypothetical protein [Aeromonas phage 4L372D]|uniref:Uncharacterized protein n=1 Tax=Aeromonas phage 4L372D TaxID=2588518 RepID=A0A5B9N7Q9_9CAUD|nr:tail fiber protein [Aeromonas phage 4L372D]QEG08562.1 hypothetical protein [Aeromonas phage 4L372D]
MALTYQAAVEKTITAGEQIHQIVNGTATEEVIVEDGSKVPSVRKALLDNFYFKDPLDWQAGQQELVFNQLRKFTDGSMWYAPNATTTNPINMGVTPVGDVNWRVYSLDAIVKLTPQIRESLRRSYAEVGYSIVAGSFEQGATIVDSKQALLFELEGKGYAWKGAVPKTIPAGSTPASSGGLGPTAWEDQSNRLLLNTAITYVTPEMFNAPCNGIDDDAPYVALALDYAVANSIPLVMNRKYLFITGVDKQYTTPVEILGTGTVTFKNFGFKLSGTVGSEVPLTSPISTFSSTTITIGDTTPFAAGDLGIIHSSTMCLSPDAGTMQLGTATASGSPSWFGEFFEVYSKTPTVITPVSPLVFNQYPLTPKPDSGVRTISTIKKINGVTGSISGIKFIRNGTGSAVEIYYGREFSVSGCKFNNKKLPGASIQFVYSHNCTAESCRVFLDASTQITFGSINPGNPNYFSFNAIKTISSQGCGAISCHFDNPSQTFDITYFEMPSLMCFMKTCTVINAKFNMATSHGGSYGSVFTGNTGINCWRGIAARSREDVIANNRLFGNRAYPTSPYTGGDTYGMALNEGYTVGATIRDNYISGFARNVFINNSSPRGAGFEYNRVTVLNNRMAYCRNHIEIDNATPTDKSIDSGIIIQGNQFDSHEREAILIGTYVRTAIIKDNIFLDAPSGSFYQIKTEGNCVGIQVVGNSFKDSAKTLWVQAITDPVLGTNSIETAAITSVNNITRGNQFSDSFVYDNTRPSLGNNFQTHNLGYKFVSVPTTTDYTLVSDTLTVVMLSPQAGAFNLVGITGGVNGRELTLFNGSGVNAITIKNGATIQTKTNADVALLLNQPVRFVYVANKWRQIN